MSVQLENISKQLSDSNHRLQLQEARFDRLEKMLSDMQSENTDLKEQLKSSDEVINQLKERVNAVEQHNRANSIRIFNLPINGDNKNPDLVSQQLYNTVLLPILQGAVSKGRIPSVPTCSELIEIAHILPGKSDNKPIICRLFSRNIRTIIMQLKKEFAPRATAEHGSNRPAPLLYPIYEDITRDTFRLMRAISSREEVLSCWSAGGTLRFRLRESDDIHRVTSIYDAVERIIELASE